MTDQDYGVLNQSSFREFWINWNFISKCYQIQDSNGNEAENKPQMTISTYREVAIHLSKPSPRIQRKIVTYHPCLMWTRQKDYI